MSCRNRNCCRLNHPNPIWCPCARTRCTNEVVNPAISESFGTFNSTSVGVIEAESVLPVSTGQQSGGGISSNGLGGVLLVAGTYQISYFASGSIPSGERCGIKLRLNGADVLGSEIFASGENLQGISLTQTIAILVEQTGTIEIVNASTATTNFATASLFIRRL